MMTLFYAGGQVTISDAMCEALLDYAAELAPAGQADVVEIEAIFADGRTGRTRIVIGPASQIISTEADHPHTDLGDVQTIAEIRARAFERRSPKAIAVDDLDTRALSAEDALET